LLVNFGERQILHPVSEPLLAPPLRHRWEILWTSESPRYGGAGTAVTATEEQWSLSAESAAAMRPVHENAA
jgi:maltooligosyltrehalose trehalohydrolase